MPYIEGSNIERIERCADLLLKAQQLESSKTSQTDVLSKAIDKLIKHINTLLSFDVADG